MSKVEQLLIKRRCVMLKEPRSKFMFLMIVILFVIIFAGAFVIKIYAGKCSLCHGAAGKGDGPAGASTNPKATNFTDKAKMTKSDDELFKIISDGSKGTAMMGYAGSISEQERWDLVAYIRSLSK